MSIDFGALLAGASSIVQAQKALRASVELARLADKPVSVAFLRNGVRLAAQTVRIEFNDTNPSEVDSDSGVGFSVMGYLFGVKDHSTLPDLDVDTWDTFVLNDREFTITSVNHTLIGQIQCMFEAVGS